MSYANDSTDTTGVQSCQKSLQILTFEKDYFISTNIAEELWAGSIPQYCYRLSRAPISSTLLNTFLPLWVRQVWIKKKKNRSQTVWPLGGTVSYLVSADGRPYERPLSLLCCSAVLLGAGELRLEPVLGGEEAVASQHRDQPHDLWPFPHAYKAEHRWTQGKDTQMQTRSFSAVSLMDAGAVAACISKILHYPALVLIAIVLAVVLVLL